LEICRKQKKSSLTIKLMTGFASDTHGCWLRFLSREHICSRARFAARSFSYNQQLTPYERIRQTSVRGCLPEGGVENGSLDARARPQQFATSIFLLVLSEPGLQTNQVLVQCARSKLAIASKVHAYKYGEELVSPSSSCFVPPACVTGQLWRSVHNMLHLPTVQS
jgi:hypothetical protein